MSPSSSSYAPDITAGVAGLSASALIARRFRGSGTLEVSGSCEGESAQS